MGGASFAVLGSTGNVYKVELNLMPSCDCPDFQKGRGLCKHVLFVWLRVLRCSEDDPRIWQKALLSTELKSALQPLFSRRSKRLPSMAGKNLRDAYARATGYVEESEDMDRRSRQPLEGEDCSICFECMTASEEARHLLSFCCSCGNNFHKDCIQRWQKASDGNCPLCREAWRPPTTSVPPGAPLPQPVGTGGASHCGYLNLSDRR